MTRWTRPVQAVLGTLALILAFAVAGTAQAATPAPVPHTTLVFSSDAQSIGRGAHRYFDSDVNTVTYQQLTPTTVAVTVADPADQNDPWTLTLGTVGGSPFHDGEYGGLDGVNGDGQPQLNFSGNGRGCGPTSTGEFTILDAAVTGDTLTRLDVTFQHHCDDTPTSFGELRIGEPDVAAGLVPWQNVAFPPTPLGTSATTALVDIKNTGPGDTINYSLDETGQQAFTMTPGNCGDYLASGQQCSVDVTFTARQVGAVAVKMQINIGTTVFLVSLTGTTGDGSTLVELDSHPGDAIGQGTGLYSFTSADANMQIGGGAGEFGGQLFSAGGDWSYNIVAKNCDLEPGTYSVGGGRVVLDIEGQGRACTVSPASSVVITQVQISPATHLLTRFDASFTQFCAGSPGALTGLLRYNATASVQRNLAPVRVLDTRSGLGASKARVPANGSVTVSLAKQPALASENVTSAMLNVSAVTPGAAGQLAVATTGSTPSVTSDLIFRAGQSISNLASVPLGANKSVTFYNRSAKPMDLVADLQAVTVATPSDGNGEFLPTPAIRIPVSVKGKPASSIALPAHGTALYDLRPYLTGPATGATAALVNLAATGTTAPGYLTGYANGKSRTSAQTMTFPTRSGTDSLAVVPVGADGMIRVYNGSTAAVRVSVDLQGYFTAGSQAAVTGAYDLVGPGAEDLNTATGLGIRPVGPIGPGKSVFLPLTEDAPGEVVLFELAVSSPTAGGSLTITGAKAPPAKTTVLTFAKGDHRSNLTQTPIGRWGLTITNHSRGTVNIAVTTVAAVAAGA